MRSQRSRSDKQSLTMASINVNRDPPFSRELDGSRRVRPVTDPLRERGVPHTTMTNLSNPPRVPEGMLFAGTLAAVLGACQFTTAADGELEVDWTIASATKRSLCTAHGADEIVVRVYDDSGVLVAEETDDCESFFLTIDELEDGAYTVTAVLVNSAADEISLELGPRDFTVENAATSSVSFNFSSSSFTYAVGTGAFTLDWTVAGSTREEACESRRATTLVVRLYDADGDQWGDDFSEECDDYSLTIPSIPEGEYSAQVQLEDEAGEGLTPVAVIDQVVIVDDETTHEAIAFEDSIFDGSLVTGTLKIEWLIEGESDASRCEQYHAASIELRLLDATEALYVDPATAPCDAFAATISELPVGDYSIGAVLVDTEGEAVTATIDPVAITVSADNVTLQEFAFPAASFL